MTETVTIHDTTTVNHIVLDTVTVYGAETWSNVKLCLRSTDYPSLDSVVIALKALDLKMDNNGRISGIEVFGGQDGYNQTMTARYTLYYVRCLNGQAVTYMYQRGGTMRGMTPEAAASNLNNFYAGNHFLGYLSQNDIVSYKP